MRKPKDTGVQLADEGSRRSIREDLDTNLLVEAGAGSGKTQMLAERMAAGVARGTYRIEHMAAVTFTRKAASELRGRFHLALEARLEELREDAHSAGDASDDTASAIARVEAAVGNLERFFAGTIHAFCARLLRERPVEAGVAPGFTELDEGQDIELQKSAWRDFVTAARAAGHPDMVALLDSDVRPQYLDAAFATVCLHEDVEFPPGDGTCPLPEPAWHALEVFWTALERELPSSVDPDTTCRVQQAARTYRRQRRVDRLHVDRPSVIASLLATWNFETKITQKFWSDTSAGKAHAKNTILPLHADFRRDIVAPYIAQWHQYVYRLAVSLLTEARASAAHERRRRNALNYGDLLVLTAKVLRENEDVRAALQQKYQHLFVDEFQDTDPVQAEIVFLLAAAAPGSNWRTLPLRPGALFVVGDPKQSIYRFRRADIDVYTRVRERFADPATGHVVPLTMNFRSVATLCHWANDVFAKRFPAEPTQHAPMFAPLDAHRPSGAGGEEAAGLFTITHACDPRVAHEADADAIAAYIRREVDAGRRHYADFLVLTRRKGARLDAYATALERLRVPVDVSGAGAFGESQEVRVLAALLRVLSDPQDGVALVGVLRGPLFGISDVQLFAYRQSGGWFNVFSGVDDEVPEGDGVRGALATLRRYHRWTRLLPAGAALDRILEDSGYLALASTSPDGVEAGDLLHAVDRVRQVIEGGGSLADAAEVLDDVEAGGSEIESLPLEPGRADVVRLMNLHKAKGLEAPVVFLADPAGGYRAQVDVHIARTGDVARGWFQIVKESEWSYAKPVLGSHVDWDAHEAAEQPYLDAEFDRLLYVAATRAREVLVVSRTVDRPRSGPAWGVLNDCLDGARELPVPGTVHVPLATPMPCGGAECVAFEAVRVAAHERVSEASWSVGAVTSDARHIARMTRAVEAVEAAADDPTKVVATDTPAHRADAGAAWGTLVHGLLEHAMRHPDATRDDLHRLALWLTVEEPQLRDVLDEALDTVQAAARATFWQEALQGEHLVEAPFLVADERKLTSGVIDLLYRRADAWQVVDYKTDVALEPEVYAQQLKAYRAALAVVGCEVDGAEIVRVRRAQDRLSQ